MPIRERLHFDSVEGARVGRFNSGVNTTFIVYRMGETLIDSGPSNQWQSVRSYIDEKPVEQLLLTHHHEDHAGNAAKIAKRFDLVPFAPVQAQEKLRKGYKTPLVQKLIWGNPKPVETLPLPTLVILSDGSKLIPVHTPGHAKDLHCFHMPDQGWLFSGDLYIAKSIRYMRSDEHLDIHVNSIRKALALDFGTLLCPHRGIVENGKAALTEKLSNILNLCEQAQELQSKQQSLEQIVVKILGPEDMMAKSTRFNFSKRNLIREALKVEL